MTLNGATLGALQSSSLPPTFALRISLNPATMGGGATLLALTSISPCPCSSRWPNTAPELSLSLTAGSLAGREAASGSPSTVSVTSTWSWSPTSLVLGILSRLASKVPGLGGWAWAGTGDRTGSLILFWLVSLSASGSLAVTAVLPLLGTLSLLIGNLVKLSRERISGFSFKPFLPLHVLLFFSLFLFYPGKWERKWAKVYCVTLSLWVWTFWLWRIWLGTGFGFCFAWSEM